MRKDLNMRTGKMCSQAAHASMKAYLENKDHPNMIEWLKGLFTKIVVSVNSETELFEIAQKAKDAGLIVAVIQDAGLTEFGGVPTFTCISVGPADSADLQPLTGHLKLL